ncbi:MAG: hypothetical protein NTW38_12105 [Candidatus Aminicenantes bacterium]|nr:hypothetical protein [Candidatus Aminicenantes bacterium]
MSSIENELIIPVYLNQRIVFDMIAMLQGGIATVTRVTSMESSSASDKQQYGATFGLNKALSALLRIDVSGNREKQKDGSSGTQINEEKVHTPASMFQMLRKILVADNKLSFIDDNNKPEIRQIVEFTAPLRKNPLIQTMDTFIGIMNMAILFSQGPPQQQNKIQKFQTPDKNKAIKTQMEQFLESLKAGDTVDIITDILTCGYRAVITLEREFLNDPTMSDLVDGHFNVLGKIISVINDDKDSINLIRKTALSAMPEKILNNALAGLSEQLKTQGFKIPSMELEAKGPVFQVLPIAIFS